ncbi:MAG: hypothetical protein K0R63_1668 [Rickettsiales bacterium]|jgi:23S rRNA (adenine2030-N6)-methyltransferase|nr:hypothetical protein [Rickettsiales bacterium]
MNYRHIYHAGNFADVLKHVILLQVLEYLKRKDTPFFVLDTHAGIGLYDLSSEEAEKTGEARDGIEALFSLEPRLTHPLLKQYLALVKHVGRYLPYPAYPGSPAIIANLLRVQDRFLANELHREDVKALRRATKFFPQPVTILHEDGYQAMRAQLPPKERRGLVLIDPPFEEKDEFETLVAQLKQGLKRWHNGVYMIWYPIKSHLPMDIFYCEIKALNVPKTLRIECWITPQNEPECLNGCGLLLLNTPWQVDTVMEEMRPELEQVFCPKGTPGITVEWLVA